MFFPKGNTAMSISTKLSSRLPKDRLSPCKCSGGWFYVNVGSITVVVDKTIADEATISRAQMAAALKLMPTKKVNRVEGIAMDAKVSHEKRRAQAKSAPGESTSDGSTAQNEAK